MFDHLGARQVILTLQWFTVLLTIITDTPRFLLRGSLTLPLREPVRHTAIQKAQENMQRMQFVLLVLVAAMLGALISMVDSSVRA
jgi:hypothetical protein